MCVEVQIFSKSVSNTISSTVWNMAWVSPIIMKGNQNDSKDYQPVSVIPAVAKIFIKRNFYQLNEYLNGNNLLTHCQSVCWPPHYTLPSLKPQETGHSKTTMAFSMEKFLSTLKMVLTPSTTVSYGSFKIMVLNRAV